MALPKQYQETTRLNLLCLFVALKTLGKAPALSPHLLHYDPYFTPRCPRDTGCLSNGDLRIFAHSAPLPRTLSSALQTCLAPPHALPQRASPVTLYLALSLPPRIAHGSMASQALSTPRADASWKAPRSMQTNPGLSTQTRSVDCPFL